MFLYIILCTYTEIDKALNNHVGGFIIYAEFGKVLLLNSFFGSYVHKVVSKYSLYYSRHYKCLLRAWSSP